MTELKQEVLMLIAEIPDEKADVFIKIRKSICELLGVNFKSRAEKNLEIMDEATNLFGGNDEIKRSRHG